MRDVRRGRTFVLDTYFYKDVDDLLRALQGEIIQPAEEAARRLTVETETP